MKSKLLLLVTIFTLFSCNDKYANLKDGLYAQIETSKGTIICQLEYDKTPITVANFVSLAEGNNPYVAAEFKGKPFYSKLKWHRVLEKFMIQGGDPLGNGSGDAGYKFKDEFHKELVHDKPGILSMANSGPGTNSSQFFITHVATPWLDGMHTVFGQVVVGMDVVNKIQQNDDIISIEIIRKGEDVKKFNAVKVFTNYYKTEEENIKKQQVLDEQNKKEYEAKFKAVIDNKLAFFAESKKASQKTGSGLQYLITKKGTGEKPKVGQQIQINYAGFLESGELFDTSIENVAQAFGKYDKRRADANGYSPIPFQFGNKQGMIPGFIEGIEKLNFGDKAVIFIPSNLAYGAGGAGGVIPPNANIIFEIELVK